MLLAFEFLPAAPTAAGVALAGFVILYRLIIDRNATHEQISTNREQIGALTAEVDVLRRHVDDLEEKYNEERSMKHKSRNDVARSVMALELVRRLAKDCTCGVLDPLNEIIDRLFQELETVQTPVDHRWPPFTQEDT